MSILIIAEHNNRTLSPATFASLTAAKKLDGDVTLLVAGDGCASVAEEAATLNGVAKVFLCEDACLKDGIAEPLSDVVVAKSAGFTHILAPGTTFGKNILPRIAARLGIIQVSDVISIENNDTFVHPIYAGNALETVKVNSLPVALTLRPTAFDKQVERGGKASLERVTCDFPSGSFSRFVSVVESKSERPELTSARIVVSGGRALQSKENFCLIEALADTLGAAIGASRAAVDAGYVPNDYQVGQTGKVVAPELYMAIGISGAIQHLAGMKDSKVIVAINKDPDAPIFQIADYGLVGDLFTLVPELTEGLKNAKKSMAS
ncbi:MAG: electron transfer flavoprotein subunit alpha/FixB family protein [Alphaproteobacteria bacterium]|nr:electron transfer flavoprotein subunit alpha/FixB family protein [Alphaproteobacteria bacterium]